MRDGVKILFYLIYLLQLPFSYLPSTHVITNVSVRPFKCNMITLLWTKILLYILLRSSSLLTDHAFAQFTFDPFCWLVIHFFYFLHSLKIGPWLCHISIFFQTVFYGARNIFPRNVIVDRSTI